VAAEVGEVLELFVVVWGWKGSAINKMHHHQSPTPRLLLTPPTRIHTYLVGVVDALLVGPFPLHHHVVVVRPKGRAARLLRRPQLRGDSGGAVVVVPCVCVYVCGGGICVGCG
jgi:hypothetical protein